MLVMALDIWDMALLATEKMVDTVELVLWRHLAYVQDILSFDEAPHDRRCTALTNMNLNMSDIQQ